MGQQWNEVAAARNAFADLIESLDQAQVEPLALALGGRPTLDELSGDGVEILRRRVADA